MGELWCPKHLEYDKEDLDQGYVTLVTELDLAIDETGLASLVRDGCCHICGLVFDPNQADQ